MTTLTKITITVLNYGVTQMININIDKNQFPIKEEDYKSFCENSKKRIIKILYLKDDFLNDKITKYDVVSYVNALIWDIYGAYIVFGNHKFLNCICELEGIKENLEIDFVRKKILDLANYVTLIPKE